MKKDWTYKKLGEVATYVNGYAFKPETWSEKGLPIIRIQNLNNANAAFNYYEGELPEKYIVNKGDLLISWSASLGAYYWEGDIAYLNQHIFKVVFDKSDIIKGFLKYAVEAKLEEMKRKVHGATMQHIVKKDFDNTIIPIPPLSIQRSIVSELDLLHSLIEKKQEQLRALDNLAQSLFYQMFSDESKWESATLKEVCSSIVRGPFGSALKKDFFVPKNDTTYKVYEQKHAIQKDAFIGSYYITKEKFTELKRFEVFPNDIIMSCSGTIGELFVIPNNAEKGVMNQALLKFHLNELITIPYFMFIMEYVKGKMTIQGCGLQNIGSVKEICKIDFPLPPLSLQQSFAAKVSAIEEQKRFISQSIKDVESLLAQRMDHYFG